MIPGVNEMTSITSIHSSVLPIPPSCVAFSPNSPDLFIVGTYFLEKNEDSKEASEEGYEEPQPQIRNGSLILCKVSGDDMCVFLFHLSFGQKSSFVDIPNRALERLNLMSLVLNCRPFQRPQLFSTSSSYLGPATSMSLLQRLRQVH